MRINAIYNCLQIFIRKIHAIYGMRFFSVLNHDFAEKTKDIGRKIYGKVNFSSEKRTLKMKNEHFSFIGKRKRL